MSEGAIDKEGEMRGAVLAIALVAIIIVFTIMEIRNRKLMKEQKENNTHKKQMLDLMAEVLGEEFRRFSYIVGYYTKSVGGFNSVTYYYFPYILAYTDRELTIFPFVKKDGELHVRNRLDLDWSNAQVHYKANEKQIKLEVVVGGEKMPIFINPVIKGGYMEKSDRPLAIYQEKEYREFVNILPGYPGARK